MIAEGQQAPPPWLETLDGDAPILLIAPHGGYAEPETAALLAPRVNDLHTADITRELAIRLDAAALINTAMDRNRLDCNRLDEVVAHAPWLLTMIADRLEQMVAEHGRALVLAVHGWNLVEARVDIGVGLTKRAGRLVPSRGAHVSVSDQFLTGTLNVLIDRLGRAGIVSTFGLRYPAGGAQNLMQVFTQRHSASSIDALRRITALSGRGAIEAVQLELSIALRFPGSLRDAAIEALSEILANGGDGAMRNGNHSHRSHRTAGAPTIHLPRSAPRKSARFGLEFYDPALRIGAMASFDLGVGRGGGRFMILRTDGSVLLFTGERGSDRESAALRVGPLRLRTDGGRLRLEFVGPALLTPDAATYVNIERALSQSSLETEVTFTIDFTLGTSLDVESVRAGAEGEGASGIPVRFGNFSGRMRIGGRDHSMSGVARIGPAFTALDDAAFDARRRLWAFADTDAGAIQANEFFVDARWHPGSGSDRCRIIACEPPAIHASLTAIRDEDQTVVGQVVSHIPLVRSDSRGRRFRTSIGFADFAIERHRYFGMFETSWRVDNRPSTSDSEAETG